MSKITKAKDLVNNTELIHKQIIKEMQLTPLEVIEYKKNNNLKF
jgi:hypothetical protein